MGNVNRIGRYFPTEDTTPRDPDATLGRDWANFVRSRDLARRQLSPASRPSYPPGDAIRPRRPDGVVASLIAAVLLAVAGGVCLSWCAAVYAGWVAAPDPGAVLGVAGGVLSATGVCIAVRTAGYLMARARN